MINPIQPSGIHMSCYGHIQVWSSWDHDQVINDLGAKSCKENHWVKILNSVHNEYYYKSIFVCSDHVQGCQHHFPPLQNKKMLRIKVPSNNIRRS
jgi:hypothetical protein